MNTFASDIHSLLKRLVSEEIPNLSENDKALLSHLEVAMSNMLVAENGLEPVYKVRFEDSGHLISQQNAGMGPHSPTDLNADFQVLASRHILRFADILYLDNVHRYLSDRFTKITLVESGHVVNNMRKDEHRRETKKRQNGSQKSHERKTLVKSHIHKLARAFLKSQPPKARWTYKEVSYHIHDDVVAFLDANPELRQNKKRLHPESPPDVTRMIENKLSELKKEEKLNPFFKKTNQ